MKSTKDREVREGPRPIYDLELDRIASPAECERLSGAAWDTLARNYPDKAVKISARRVGMRVRDALRLPGRKPR